MVGANWMKAIVNTAPEHLEWREWPMPQPLRGQVRIRTTACGICATDLEMIAGWERTGFPSICGHEWAGVVDSVGDEVDAKLVGKPCVGENVLSNGDEVGFEQPGGYAQYLLTEAANVRLLPVEFALSSAVMIEPLAVCVRALRRLRLENTEAALIIGDGPIGQLMLLLLKLHGVARVMMVGGRQNRLALARQLGAACTVDFHDAASGELGPFLREELGGEFPSVIEASGSDSGIRAALDLAMRGGKILVVGDYRKARADFPWNRILHRELELIGSNASAGSWDEAVQLAVSGDVPLHRLISRIIAADSFHEAIALSRDGDNVLKVVLQWPV